MAKSGFKLPWEITGSGHLMTCNGKKMKPKNINHYIGGTINLTLVYLIIIEYEMFMGFPIKLIKIGFGTDIR